MSLLTDKGWSDLNGCDYVMDLLAGAETDVSMGQTSAHADYLFSDMGDRCVKFRFGHYFVNCLNSNVL